MRNFARRAALGGLAFVAVTGPALAQTDQNFTLVNKTGFAIVTLNVSPASESRWGPDILGREFLANGESAEVAFPAEEEICLWDLRVTYEDGDVGEWRQTNLCEISTVELES